MQLHNKTFHKFITAGQMSESVAAAGAEISEMYAGKNPICIVVMQGAFVFAADILRRFNYSVEVEFIRIRSYTGMQSNAITQEVILPDVVNRHVIIIEDIIDSGNTLHFLMQQLQAKQPASVFTLALLQKQVQRILSADKVCFEIPDKFVVGYGLDYDQSGRNLPDIWQLSE